MFTLTQVYGGVRTGAQCLSCKADGVNCKKNYVWLTNYVQKLREVAQLFGVVVLVRVRLWFAWWIGMKKASGFPKAFAFTMVETRGIEPLTS